MGSDSFSRSRGWREVSALYRAIWCMFAGLLMVLLAAHTASASASVASASAVGTYAYDLYAGNQLRSDTEVVMADGSRKSISELEVGDEVIATDPETGLTGVRAVTAVHSNLDLELADLTVVDADGDVSVIHTTQHHPFWSVADGKWTDVVDLDEGDRLRSVDGSLLTVVGLRAFTGQHWMWDLTIDDIHTYFVAAGSEDVLVHNCGEINSAGGVGDQPYGPARPGPASPSGHARVAGQRPPQGTRLGRSAIQIESFVKVDSSLIPSPGMTCTWTAIALSL
jgi:hypothetical protein